MARVNMHVVRLQRQLTEALKCPTCRKRTTVANTNLRGYETNAQAARNAQPEVVSVDTHCTCPGGPAEHLAKQLLAITEAERLAIEAIRAESDRLHAEEVRIAEKWGLDK